MTNYRTQGTRSRFRKWLERTHRMTYTKYTTLDMNKKAEIQREYRKAVI